MNMVGNDFSVEPLQMLQEVLHKIGALNAERIHRPIFNLGGGHQLITLIIARDKKGLQVRPRRVGCSAMR